MMYLQHLGFELTKVTCQVCRDDGPIFGCLWAIFHLKTMAFFESELGHTTTRHAKRCIYYRRDDNLLLQSNVAWSKK